MKTRMLALASALIGAAVASSAAAGPVVPEVRCEPGTMAALLAPNRSIEINRRGANVTARTGVLNPRTHSWSDAAEYSCPADQTERIVIDEDRIGGGPAEEPAFRSVRVAPFTGGAAEAWGISEVEVEINAPSVLYAWMSPAAPRATVGRLDRTGVVPAAVDINGDGDWDITGRIEVIAIIGTDGDDVIDASGARWGGPPPAPVHVLGGNGKDQIFGGSWTSDIIDGGAGDDVIFSVDARSDVVRGGPGIDAARIDPRDSVSSVERRA
ncbi:MAG TPA: hypothetical protein VM841_11840 [Actinomycetota bacterium]|nr:hypothetical protein [Actinomycetota bacterium]